MLTKATISNNVKKFKQAATHPLAQLVVSQFKLAITRQYKLIIRNAPVILSSSEMNTYLLSTTQALPSLTECSIFSKDNLNLTNAQKELLLWHCRWNHCNLQRCQMILSQPQQPKDSQSNSETFPQMVKPILKGVTTTCPNFRCEVCRFAKQKRQTPCIEQVTRFNDQEGILSKDNVLPGDKVSFDHYMSST